MSDIAPDVPVDDEFSALIAKLSPFLLEVAKAAVTEAVAAVPVPVKRPASVTGVNPSDRTATVLVDGDTVAITAQCLDELPNIADRVMVEFCPPSAVFVVGNHSAAGVPAGTVISYAGPITAHAGAVQTSATPGQPPRGWLWCAGQAVSRSTYNALFRAISTTYGSGDGSTTFNVPDFRGRIPLGLDNMGGSDAGRLSSANTLGTTGGAETHSLASGNLPTHTHDMGNHTHGVGSFAGPSHTHDLGNHTHGAGSFSQAHTHGGNMVSGAGGAAAGGETVATTWGASTTSQSSTAVSGTSSTPSTNTSGGASSTSISGTSAVPSTNTTGNGGFAGTAVNHMPPFVSIHWLIKA